MDELKYIDYEVAGAVATITLARPEKANAQNERMLDELHDRFLAAEYDDEVRVIVLRAQGRHFSAGHDLGGNTDADPDAVSLSEPDGRWHLNRIYRWEARKYLGYSWHWRNIPKPTIGAIQGKAIAGALNLIWPLDLLVVADDVEFSDPVVLMAIGGVEYHGHTWELGARRAKDLLFTQRTLGAEEALQIGLAREVVPQDELWDRTQELAEQIAANNAFGLAQAKRAVNQTLDVQGYYSALQSVFDVHTVGHGNAISISGYPILMRLDEMKQNLKKQ
ncbi:enoyl-CoA hydratase [Candidatus Poriferisocius sp.]|uniref:enoyl-CoA hydratase n=1 Tax=Candidatus Poriferisocius sp. TaxID=3101276 RepID=UPI003B0210D1